MLILLDVDIAVTQPNLKSLCIIEEQTESSITYELVTTISLSKYKMAKYYRATNPIIYYLSAGGQQFSCMVLFGI